MTDAEWLMVFDASTKPLNLGFMLGAFPFLVVAVVLFRRHSAVKRRGGAIFPIVFPIVMGCLAFLWTVTVSGFEASRYLAAQSALRDGTAKVVKGPVENFHPMPFTGHDTERFDIEGVHFAYSDYIITSGFNHTSSHGGPVRADQYVRIHYHYISGNRGPVILRLEVRR